MRIFVADDTDTLSTLAVRFKIGIIELIRLNPHIPKADENIAGKHVYLPGSQAQSPTLETVQLGPPVSNEYADHWIPVTPLEQMAQTEYDVLIVGTGAAGGAVLWRLSEQWGNNGKKIGIVETGDIFLPTHLINIPTYNIGLVESVWKNPRYMKRVSESNPTNNLPPLPVDYLISKVLGGKTLHWGAACIRMAPFDLSLLPVSPQEMNTYYNIAERVMNVTRNLAQNSSFQDVMLERLWNNGFPEAIDIPMAVDLAQSQLGRMHSNVFFSSIIFLASAFNIRPVDLTVKTCVIRVLTEQKRVTGLQVVSPDNKLYNLKAKTVVLAAGTLETPRILLHSGIEGEAIGRYLTNHSRLDALGYAQRADFPENLGILNILLPRMADRLFQMQINYLNFTEYKETPLLGEVPVTFIPSGMIESRFDNRVALDPERKDKHGVPDLKIYLSYSEKDFNVIYQMSEAIQQAAAAMNISLLKKNGQADITLRRPGGENHDMGTCRMGFDPATSAANRFGQIHGVSGLYVAGNCVIPTTIAANPTLTSVALAIRTADYIAEKQ